MNSSIFWHITPYSPLKVNWRFGGTCRLYFQGRAISWSRNERTLFFPPVFTSVSCSALALKVKVTCSSESSVEFQRTTRRYIAEVRTLHCQTWCCITLEVIPQRLRCSIVYNMSSIAEIENLAQLFNRMQFHICTEITCKAQELPHKIIYSREWAWTIFLLGVQGYQRYICIWKEIRIKRVLSPVRTREQMLRHTVSGQSCLMCLDKSQRVPRQISCADACARLCFLKESLLSVWSTPSFCASISFLLNA
jgi:hypothetical protein